ncbi:MAG: type II toxin-antitoxin system PemK/MazF family toxin [Myxococcales bacterium]|nr:type II toxin-antitoxin system PemK/MazF family toxin [Myxococcales bacterium]
MQKTPRPQQNGDMPLTFQPRPGSVVYCDFVGLRAPEMIKRRPVVIVNRLLRP